MIEKFNDFESAKYLDHEGDFIFTVKSAELKEGKSGPMVVLSVSSDEGDTTLYHSLSPKARWSYNNLIAACLGLTKEQRKTYELDYEVIHNQLIGKQFIGHVSEDSYEKQVKIPLDDGTFDERTETKITYKITNYQSVDG